MTTTFTKRNLLKVLFLLLLTLALAGCHPWQANQGANHILNRRSRLLPVLLQKSDLPGNWVWQNQAISQEEDSKLNPNELENATEFLTGVYGKEKIFIAFTHRLEKYKKPLTSSFIEAEQAGLSDYPPLTDTKNFVKVGEYQMIACDMSKSSGSTSIGECQITIGYRYVLSQLTVFIDKDLDNQDVEAMVNQVLTDLDKRIKGIDYPKK